MSKPDFIHGHADAGDNYYHIVESNHALDRTLCGKPVIALARSISIQATCPVCIRIYQEKRKRIVKK